MFNDDIWKKSTKSGGTNDCVEVALTVDLVGVRDSKDKAGPVLTVPAGDWSAFLAEVKAR